jgi:hypothetical protein
MGMGMKKISVVDSGSWQDKLPPQEHAEQGSQEEKK